MPKIDESRILIMATHGKDVLLLAEGEATYAAMRGRSAMGNVLRCRNFATFTAGRKNAGPAQPILHL